MNLGSLQEYRLRMLQVRAALSVLQRCHVAIPVSSYEKAAGKTPPNSDANGRSRHSSITNVSPLRLLMFPHPH